MLNEGSTLLLSLCLGTAIAGMKWLTLKRLIRTSTITTIEARAKFNTVAIAQLVLSGSIYFWILLYALPASVLKFESGHNFIGVPLAGLMAGAVAGVVVSIVGGFFLRASKQDAT